MNKRIVSSSLALLAAFALQAVGAESTDPSVYDKIWDSLVLIDNKDAAVIQNLAVVGRLQGDVVLFNSEDNGEFQDELWRRTRLGLKAKVFKDFTLHGEMDLDMNEVDSGQWDEFYGRITDAYLGWKPCDEASLKFGKQSAGFTLDGATSSTKLHTPERSIVADNLWFSTEYFTGIGASGTMNEFDWKVGGYSASGEPEFGHFESGYFGLLSAGHKVGESGSLRVDYVYNDPDYTGVSKDSDYIVGTRGFEHIVSLVYKQKLGEKMDLWTDLSGAKGIDGKLGDMAGIEIMPMYNISEKFQLVGQYAAVTSLDGDAQVVMSRYAQKNAGKANAVETAHNLLLGFNWFLYGHKLKWQNAVEYNFGQSMASTGNDYNGYGFTSALRISW
jgi:phosphate-selective porin OprO/OprP